MRDQMLGSSDTDRIDIAVIICAYGQDELTRQTLVDLEQSTVRHMVCVVDNKGSFRARERHTVRVIRPLVNLGWTRGSNLGVHSMMSYTDAQVFILLNNDVRLSHGFVDGLYEAWQHTGGAIIGPTYDHNWPQQNIEFNGPASEYPPSQVDRLVPFVDGTCMLIDRQTFDAVGFLDEDHWPKWGWGCDKDFCFRARAGGGSVYVTERSYLSHSARGTVAFMPDFSEAKAEAENDQGMTVKWGPQWRDRLYDGFDSCSRVGLVQKRFGASD